MADKIRDGIRTWLRVQPAQRGIINIQEIFDFEGNAIKNKIWYRGVNTKCADSDRFFWCSPSDEAQNHNPVRHQISRSVLLQCIQVIFSLQENDTYNYLHGANRY